MTSLVSQVPAAPAGIARAHFAQRLSLETDCADVHASMACGVAAGFVLLDVRGPHAYAQSHLPGAISLPYREMTLERMAHWPDGTLFVVYCAGPHCNAADWGAMRLAELNRPVKLMIGGMTGWVDEGFAYAAGGAPAATAAAAERTGYPL
jgi:rhodanese-related sulfurtransferase